MTTHDPRISKYVIPIANRYGIYGVAFHIHKGIDKVSCEKCGRFVQWPDAAKEHARYHDRLDYPPSITLRGALRLWWRRWKRDKAFEREARR